MPTQSIQVGVPTTILQNVVYALPARACWVSAVNDVEASVDGTLWKPQAISSFSDNVEQVFVRCTTSNTIIICRPI